MVKLNKIDQDLLRELTTRLSNASDSEEIGKIVVELQQTLSSVRGHNLGDLILAAVPGLKVSEDSNIKEILRIAEDVTMFLTTMQTLIDSQWAVLSSLYLKYRPNRIHQIDIEKANRHTNIDQERDALKSIFERSMSVRKSDDHHH